jgi:hypothetical protein
VKPGTFRRTLLESILSGGYTPLDVREFVELCYTLALPLIRSKLALGKFHHAVAGMREADIVYDCLADLFQRDEKGMFVRIQSYFSRDDVARGDASDEELLVALRRLVFLKVQNNLIRLLSDADPTLGKVLRNIRLAMQKEKLFMEVDRFGETYLATVHSPFPSTKPACSLEWLERELLRVVLLQDTTNIILRRLRTMLEEQTEFQRAVPLIPLALIVRKVFALRWETEEVVGGITSESLQDEEVRRAASRVCETVRKKMAEAYGKKRKLSGTMVERYLAAIEDILIQDFASEGRDGTSYFEILRRRIPSLTKSVYMKKHRSVVEYLAKSAKKEMRAELRRL